MTEHESILIRWVELPEGVHPCLTPRERRAALLLKLSIVQNDGESPLQAWLRSMHLENGLEPQSPAHIDIATAILENDGARRFMWAIAG